MSLFGINADTPCEECGAPFAEHEYVPDSIDQYRCPHGHQDYHYGYFNGGDPRDFTPDYEVSSPEEIENWKRACDAADESESAKNLPCPHSTAYDADGKLAMHVTRAPFGLGVTVVEYETFFVPRESDDEEEDGE